MQALHRLLSANPVKPTGAETPADALGATKRMSSLDEGDNQSTVECPTCESEYDTERCMKIHHKHAHGESIAGVPVTCDWCGDTKRVIRSELDRYDTHFCDNECRAKGAAKKDYGGWVETECDYCGVAVKKERWRVERYDHVFCDSECFGEHQAAEREYPTGADHPRWVGTETVTCAYCGTEKTVRATESDGRKFCSNDCLGAYLRTTDITSGENSPFWKGGQEGYYGPRWPEQRAKAIERDGGRCQSCGLSREEHVDTWGEDIHVHHIRRFNDFDSSERAHQLSNLVTLCRPCHMGKWEGVPLRPQLAD